MASQVHRERGGAVAAKRVSSTFSFFLFVFSVMITTRTQTNRLAQHPRAMLVVPILSIAAANVRPRRLPASL